eukprot:39514-Rhodomonas_salina.4
MQADALRGARSGNGHPVGGRADGDDGAREHDLARGLVVVLGRSKPASHARHAWRDPLQTRLLTTCVGSSGAAGDGGDQPARVPVARQPTRRCGCRCCVLCVKIAPDWSRAAGKGTEASSGLVSLKAATLRFGHHQTTLCDCAPKPRVFKSEMTNGCGESEWRCRFIGGRTPGDVLCMCGGCAQVEARVAAVRHATVGQAPRRVAAHGVGQPRRSAAHRPGLPRHRPSNLLTRSQATRPSGAEAA